MATMQLIDEFNHLSVEELEAFYDKDDFESLLEISSVLRKLPAGERRRKIGHKALRELWPEERLFIENTHWIQPKEGTLCLFRWNYAQDKLYQHVLEQRKEGLPIRIICLKARQLGFSTWITSFFKEQIDWNANRNAMTISYDDDSSKDLFSKVRDLHARDYFPRPTQKSATDGMRYAKPHNSQYYVRTAGNQSAGRGTTVQYMHNSELPMWANATEVLDAADQCVPEKPDTFIFHESTAKGAQGEFYDLWNDATRGENDFIPFFAPWFWDPDYAIPLTGDQRNRFGRSLNHEDKEVMAKYGLTLEQMAWRRRTIKNKLRGSLAKFKQEYPACAEEAFLSSGHPAFDAEAIMALYPNCGPAGWQGDIFMTEAEGGYQDE